MGTMSPTVIGTGARGYAGTYRADRVMSHGEFFATLALAVNGLLLPVFVGAVVLAVNATYGAHQDERDTTPGLIALILSLYALGQTAYTLFALARFGPG